MSIEAYEKWLILNSRSQRTIFNKKKTLTVLLRELPNWDIESVDNFLISLKKKGCRNTTLNTYIITIRTYAQCVGLSDALKNYKFLKNEPTNKGTLSDEEIESFLSLPKPHGASQEQYDQATLFFYCLAYTGCRPCEIGKLKTAQVYDNFIVLTDTKTRRPRNVPLPEPLRERIKKHMSKINREYLFITQKGKVYTDHFWIPAFNTRLKRLGINRPNLTTYSFRHSMATSLLKQDIAIGKISKLLGNSPEQIYKSYDHLVITDVEKALNKHPLIRKNSKANLDEILEEIEKLLKQHSLVYSIAKTAKEIKLQMKLG